MQRSTFDSGSAEYKGNSQYAQYLNRPHDAVPHVTFHSMSWYWYRMWYDQTQRPRGMKAAGTAVFDTNDTRYYAFPASNAQHATMVAMLRPQHAIVSVVGGGLRPLARRNTPVKVEEYWRAIALLFVPHRTMADINPTDGQTWESIVATARATPGQFCPYGERFIEHYEDRWTSVFDSQENAKAFRAKTQELDAEIRATTQGGRDRNEIPHDMRDEYNSDSGGSDFRQSDDEFTDDEQLPDDDYEDVPELADETEVDAITAALLVPQRTAPLTVAHFPRTAVRRLEEGLRYKDPATMPAINADGTVRNDDAGNDGEDVLDTDALHHEHHADASTNDTGITRRHLTVTEVQAYTELITMAYAAPQPATTAASSSSAAAAAATDAPPEIDYAAARFSWLQQRNADAALGQPLPATLLVTVTVDTPQKEIPYCASLAEIKAVFTLSDDQNRAFTIAGRAMLEAFQRDEQPHEPEATDDVIANALTAITTSAADLERLKHQVLLFLHGMGGSGKSLTIRALIALALSWEKPKAVLTACKSGVAAVNVDGCTMDSLMYKPAAFFHQVRLYTSVSLRDTFVHTVRITHLFTPTTRHTPHPQVKLMIVDEVSMAGQRMMDKFDRALQAKLNRHILFAGINIIFSGDFYQLPPVQDNPLYEDPATTVAQKKKRGAPPSAGASASRKRGYDIYVKVSEANTVVLDTIKRTDNAEYADLQTKVRVGDWSDPNTMDTINSRYNASFPADTEPAPGDKPRDTSEDDYVPIMVVENKVRHQIYDAQMRALSPVLRAHNRDLPILLRASFDPIKRQHSRSTHRATFTHKELKHLLQLRDHELERLPSNLLVYIGKYVLFTHNIGLPYGIANGTRGRIVGYQFPKGTTFEETTYKGIAVRIPIAAKRAGAAAPTADEHPTKSAHAKVDFVLVEVLTSATLTPAPNQPPGLPRNTIAVPIIAHPITRNVAFPPSVHGPKGRKSAGVTMHQVPLRQAAVLTNYSIQGNQYRRYIIAQAKARQYYIPFSRGKCGLSSIILRIKLDTKFTEQAKPPQHLTDAIARLRALHAATKLRVP